jgi:hypothetical protein
LNKLINLLAKYKKWYKGKYIPLPEDNPDSSVISFPSGYYKQPILAKSLRQIAKFWRKHWQWMLGFIVTVALLIVAILALIK